MLNFIIGILDRVVCKIGLSLLFVNVIFKVTAESDWFMTTMGYFWGTGLSRVLPAIVCMVYFYTGAWKKKTLIDDRNNSIVYGSRGSFSFNSRMKTQPVLVSASLFVYARPIVR